YLINQTPCRLMDITDLFLGTGGGARAYSIIEQGRIGLIVSSRSEDRRNMIEEAAGITKYKSARRKAERRMDKTRQNLLRVTDVVTEIERSLATLKRQAQKTERYKRYRAEQTDLELYIATHRYLELRAQSTAISQSLDLKESSHFEARATLETLEARVASLRLDEQAAKGHLDEKTAVSYEINNEIKVIENEIRHLQEAVQRYQSEEQGASQQKIITTGQREEMLDESRLLEQQLVRLDKETVAIAQRHEELASQSGVARERLEKLAEDHDSRREEISRTRARLAAAESAEENLLRRIEDAEARLETAREERTSLSEQAQEFTRMASSLEERKTVVEDKLNGARTTEEQEREIFDELRWKVEACDNERLDIRDQLQVKTSRKTSLEEVMTSLESHDRAVREALELFQEEGESLVDCLLLDRVDCPKQYEQALAAALGDRLQGLLVKDRESGLKLLDMLRERDMGRITVLVTNQQHLQKDTAIELCDDSDVLAPLVDLLEIKDEATDLVSGLLRGIYVVKTLDDAQRLWEANKGSAAFVTIDGQLLESNGAMRGGRGSSAGADLLGQRRQIRELTTEVEALGTRHDDIQQRFEALKEDLTIHRDTGERAREEAQNHEITLAEVRRDNTRAIEDLARINESFETIDREIAHQEEMVTQAKADHDLATAEAEAARKAIEELEAFIKEQSSEIEACREESERLSSAASDARVQQAALEQQQQNATERTAQLARTLSEIEERLESIEEGRRHAFAEIGRAAGEAVKQRELLHERLDETQRIQAGIDELRQDLETAAQHVAAAEEELKTYRTLVDTIAQEISELKMEERESGMEVEYLLESVEERNDCNLLRVAGDYHMRQIPDEEVQARAEDLKRLISRMGAINLTAIDEFESQSKRYNELTTQKDDLEQALEDLERAISQMDKESKRRFKETFEDVSRRFKEIFPRLFKGGRAELLLTDPSDMLHTGVDIVAQPPGKRLGNIGLMSGGEKALTAVALLFSIFLHRPSPFCVLDEVDAPLDEANVDRFIDMVHQMTDRSQFIIITHSKLTMERSNTLYGVTMQEPGVSKMVSVRLSNTAQSAVVNE
ncbi:MAG: chromosome segregation protein SMC, partial [Deltaproteobacteria bacterium]|nr:chromosome segregation protein SMC [Deltaproteobacteria bacterium]